jgi:hypothetical protein
MSCPVCLSKQESFKVHPLKVKTPSLTEKKSSFFKAFINSVRFLNALVEPKECLVPEIGNTVSSELGGQS